jgi:hypothetical protein
MSATAAAAVDSGTTSAVSTHLSETVAMSATGAVAVDGGTTSAVNTHLPETVARSIRELRAVNAAEQTIEPSLPPELASATEAVLPEGTQVRPRVANFTALQEWDGYVISMNGDAFGARLTNLTNKGPQDAEEVEIPYEELDESSVRRMEIGSLFRWSIGYERSSGGQKTRVSRIILRQLPRWRKSELERANQEAAEIVNAIEWQD